MGRYIHLYAGGLGVFMDGLTHVVAEQWSATIVEEHFPVVLVTASGQELTGTMCQVCQEALCAR